MPSTVLFPESQLLRYIVDATVTSIDGKLMVKLYPNFFRLNVDIKDFPSLFDPKIHFEK